MKFVAYYRVSTARQGASGLGLDAQRSAVERYVQSVGGQLLASFEEVESGAKSDRPALAKAMERCRLTGAKLLIAKLDRLSRNVAFLANLMETGVPFVACDMPSANNLTVHIMAAMAQHEREMISARTKAALGSIKAKLDAGEQHVANSGRVVTRLGNPNGLKVRSTVGHEAVALKAKTFGASVLPVIREAQEAGCSSLAQVAAHLNALGVLSAAGKPWTKAGVKRVLDRAG